MDSISKQGFRGQGYLGLKYTYMWCSLKKKKEQKYFLNFKNIFKNDYEYVYVYTVCVLKINLYNISFLSFI